MADEIMPSIGENVRRLRTEKGISQEKLAELASTSQTTIDKIERGETKRSRYINHIARALEVSLASIDPELINAGQQFVSYEANSELVKALNNKGRIPIFSSAETPTGELRIGSEIMYHEPRPSCFRENDRNGFGLIIHSSSMSPELNAGDVAYFVGGQIADHSSFNRTYLFMESHPSRFGSIRHLISEEGEDWIVKRWATPDLERLSRRLMPHRLPLIGRVVAR